MSQSSDDLIVVALPHEPQRDPDICRWCDGNKYTVCGILCRICGGTGVSREALATQNPRTALRGAADTPMNTAYNVHTSTCSSHYEDGQTGSHYACDCNQHGPVMRFPLDALLESLGPEPEDDTPIPDDILALLFQETARSEDEPA